MHIQDQKEGQRFYEQWGIQNLLKLVFFNNYMLTIYIKSRLLDPDPNWGNILDPDPNWGNILDPDLNWGNILDPDPNWGNILDPDPNTV